MAIIQIPNKWSPRDYQLPVLRALDNGIRRAVSVWHRRGGKDTTALNYTAKRMMETVGNYWHLFPMQTQARKAIWKGINKDGIPILDQVFPPEIVKSKNGTEMIIELVNGSTWQLCGSDNYNSLVGSNPIGVVFSEWSLCNPNAWSYIRPILAENGGWSWFIYTPRGKNHGWTLLQLAKRSKDWFAEVLTVNDTNSITEETLASERDEMDESDYQQEYYCSFEAAIKGAYYAKQFKAVDEENRITTVPHDPEAKVYTAWDLGYSDDTTIWFYQVIRDEIHVIDYYFANEADVDHYCEQVLGLKMVYDDDNNAVIGTEPLEGAEHRQAYEYEKHYIPHDARAKTLASGGKSVQEQLAVHLGWSYIRVLPALSVQDGIQAVRKMFKKLWFDDEKTDQGVNALRQYKRKYDENNKCFINTPLHDWTSHPADGFRMLAIAYEKEMEIIEEPQEELDCWGRISDNSGDWKVN